MGRCTRDSCRADVLRERLERWIATLEISVAARNGRFARRSNEPNTGYGERPVARTHLHGASCTWPARRERRAVEIIADPAAFRTCTPDPRFRCTWSARTSGSS